MPEDYWTRKAFGPEADNCTSDPAAAIAHPTTIWHEMAHLGRANERGARKAEQELWTRYVRDQVCDEVTALRYLRALASRPDDQLVALR